MPSVKPNIATQVLDFIRANATSEPQARCLVTVATRLSSDFRGFKRVEKVISDLVYKKQLVRGPVGNWAEVLSLPE